MRIPRKVALLGATAVTLALIPASSASAFTPSERKAEKKQNDRIKKLSKDLSAAKNKLGVLETSLTAQAATITGVDGRLKVLEGGVPAILKGLGDLKTGLETAGAGLNSLKSLATSTEYGVAQLFVGGTPVGGAFLVTPDIPDAVQQAQTMGTFNVGAASGAVTVQVAVRSAESDGKSGGDAAAHCRVTATDSVGRIVTSAPNGDLSGAPVYPIPLKSAQTSKEAANAGFPFGPKTVGDDKDNLVDLTQIGTNAVAPAGAPSAAATTNVTVQLSCVDITASAEDPSA